MRRIICILMCLCMTSIALALSITNGDFEDYVGSSATNADVRHWWDYGSPDLEYVYQGPFHYRGGSLSIDDSSACVFSGEEANADEDGGNHAYFYQGIGIYDGIVSAVDIELDWGAPNYSRATSGEMGVTVMILESDGTFEPNEWDGAAHDIYGFVKTEEEPDLPITELGRGTAFRYVEKGAAAMHERFQIDLSSATVGNELFLRFNGYKGNVTPWVGVDNITMSPAYVLNQSPENGAVYIAAELTSAENDLVFDVTDPVIVAVDVLFTTDPNFPEESSKIVTGMEVTQGQYRIDLEDLVLPDDHLEWNKNYYWKVLAYEPNAVDPNEVVLKYTGLATSFKTIQYGPFLDEVIPNIQGVWSGDEAVFSLEYYNKTDTFQWYKEGVSGPLENGTKYAGVDSNSLTIYDCQTADEGFYYCKGWYTESGPTVVEAQSLTSGELSIKELKTYYPFESTKSDAQGTYTPDVIGDKHAYLMGGASVVTDPDPNTLIGGYLSLVNPRGVTHTQYADIMDDSVAHHKEITISCWVKPTILDLDYERFARVFDFGTDNDDYFYLTLLQNSNIARCEMRREDDEGDVDDNSIDAVGEIGYGTKWLYVVLTIEDITEINDEGEEETITTGKIYINGELAPDTDDLYDGGGLYYPSEIEKTLNYIGKAIATDDGDSYPNFDGQIDELKIYNYAQTAEEVAQEYMAVRTDVEFVCNMDDYDLGDWDYDESCEVDLPDLAVMAEKWLLNYFIYPN